MDELIKATTYRLHSNQRHQKFPELNECKSQSNDNKSEKPQPSPKLRKKNELRVVGAKKGYEKLSNPVKFDINRGRVLMLVMWSCKKLRQKYMVLN